MRPNLSFTNEEWTLEMVCLYSESLTLVQNHLDYINKKGHGELLKLRLLEKSARHDFIIARHRSSNNIFSCQLLESS